MTRLIYVNSQMLPTDQLALRADDCGFTLGGCVHFLAFPPNNANQAELESTVFLRLVGAVKVSRLQRPRATLSNPLYLRALGVSGEN